MRPIEFLILLLIVFVAILAIDHLFRRQRASLISKVGAEFLMNYSPLDRFALTERLATAPQWAMRASELSVKDVLYATRDGTRCFIATVKCRWSLDQDASRFIVRVLEQSDHHAWFDISSHASERARDDAELYRRLLSSWPGCEKATVGL